MNELIERARELWRGVSPREQILIGVGGGMLLLTILVFGLIMPFVNMAESAVTRVENAEQQMQLMARLQRDYSDIQSRLEGVEERIQNQRGQRNIRTQLEGLAKNSSVKISSMEERQASKNDHYTETKVEVALKNVTLSQTVKYLHNIEASDRQLSVKSLRIKGRPEKSQLLDVTFSVSSFEPT